MAGENEAPDILLLGANGQLGYELQRTLDSIGNVTALRRPEADLADTESLRMAVRNFAPDILVNAAAYTAVDKAEDEPDLAMAVNAVAPRVLAEEAGALDACFVHYSTDFVFDGRQGSPYIESIEPNPLSIYGQSKLAGERGVASACSRHLIFRTSWVFGRHGNNFLKTILKVAAEGNALRVVGDQAGVPTSASLIAATTTAVLSEMAFAPGNDERWGLYHLVAAGETSWYAYAKYVLEQAETRGLELELQGDDIVRIETTEYPLAATRPANSVLDTAKLRETFGLDLPHWQSGVDEVLDHIVSKLR